MPNPATDVDHVLKSLASHSIKQARDVRATVRNGGADLYLGEWYADYPDPEDFSFPMFNSRKEGPGGNYAFLTDTALDSMILRARSTPDTAEQARLAREIARRLIAAPGLTPWPAARPRRGIGL